MKIDDKTGLVLEGGGFKGIFTAGVLDFLIDKDIKFTSIYGVSAGACALCSYVSGQRHRVYDTFVDYADMKKFCSPQSLLLTGDLINADMSYHLIPDYLNPYDYVTAAKYPGKAYAVCTDIETGMPAYFQLDNIHENMPMIQASASMPLVSRNVRIGDHLYLDGGMSVQNHKDSLKERFQVMKHHYGLLPTLLAHAWFLIRGVFKK